MAVTQHRQQQDPPPPPPESGAIVKGKVSRIESYGAFISILTPSSSSRFCHRGLLHISQLSSYKVEKVDDCLELDDEIYVKVLNCEEEGGEQQQQQANFDDEYSERRLRRDDRRDRRKRYKISLSLKYASQDGSFTDLDPNNEQYHKESRGRRNAGEGQNSSTARTNNGPSSLETSLNSQIGMGMAIDPLSAMKQVSSSNCGSRLILRDAGKKKVMINGYELLDDNEGEVDIPPPQSQGNAVTDQTDYARRPVGRGRGSTLPSWMTQASKNDGIQSNSMKNSDRSRSSSSDDGRRGKQKKKGRKKDDKKKRKKRKRYNSEDDSVKKSSRRKRHHKKHKSKSRRKYSRNQYSSDDDSIRSRSRSGSRDGKRDGNDERHNSRKRSKSRSKVKKQHRRKGSYYSSDDDDDDDRERRSASPNSQNEMNQESADSRNDKTDSGHIFKSIDEAKELIKKLENKE